MPEDDKLEQAAERLAKRERKKKTRRFLYIIWVLLLALFIYLGVQVILVLTPKIRREVAILETMTDSITAKGFVALESAPVEAGSGVLYFTVDSGERVSAGTVLAEIYSNQAGAEARGRLDELRDERDRLESAMNTNSLSGDTENYMSQLQAGLSGMLTEIGTGDYTGVAAYAGDAELAANKLLLATGTGDTTGFEQRLQTLNSQISQYETRAIPRDELLAPTTGYFVQASGKDRIPMAYETLAAMSVGELEAQLDKAPEYYGGNVAGYIISDYKWSFFALVDAQQAGRFTVGSKTLSISFAEIGTSQIPVTVQSVTEEDGSDYALVELYCEYMSPEILKMQNQNVEIIFSVQTGVRISKDALRVYEGEEGVFVAWGGIVYFRRVEILLEDDFYILIPATTDNTVNQVKLYDEVIVDSGGMELGDESIL